MQQKTVRHILQVALVVLAASACASSGERAGSNTSTVLTQEELLAATGNNLYEAIDRVRPRWLQARAVMSLQGNPQPQVLVYMNQSYLGGPDQLRQFHPRDVVEVEYMDGPQAAARLRGYDPTIHVAGAIIVKMTARQ